MAEDRATWFQRWAAGMGRAPGGKVDRGPVETLASKAGRQAPKRSSKAGRVPPPTSGQTPKLQDSGQGPAAPRLLGPGRIVHIGDEPGEGGKHGRGAPAHRH